MNQSLLTPKCTLVPSNFFDPANAREVLAEVADLEEDDIVGQIAIPVYNAVLIYCSSDIRPEDSENDISGKVVPLPEMYYILKALPECPEYNKILCSWKGGYLFMGIAQGRTLLLANVYPASDFITAEYYIFLAMKSLQLNPEVSTICWNSDIGPINEMSLYRYFKAVEQL